MITLNNAIFDQVVEGALLKSAGSIAWTTAINKAVEVIENDPWAFWDGSILIVGSRTRGKIYELSSARVCTCEAFTTSEKPQPCWHRACYRIMEVYQEATVTSFIPSPEPIEVVKKTFSQEEKSVIEREAAELFV